MEQNMTIYITSHSFSFYVQFLTKKHYFNYWKIPLSLIKKHKKCFLKLINNFIYLIGVALNCVFHFYLVYYSQKKIRFQLKFIVL